MTAAAPARPRARRHAPPIAIGPTWRRSRRGDFVLPPPSRTLGWQILGWTAEYLLQPDGPDAGHPWRFTDEQARFLLWWYAVDDAGRFTYRSGMLRRMKGWGKDPVGAAICSVEFVGPCRFAGWAKDGAPIAAAHAAAWVQTAAVSRDQTRNTMTLFPGMLSPRAQEEFAIDLGKEIIYAERGRKRIEAVTSSPRALEGGRATFVLKNETHHWLRPNEGHEMAKVIARNVAKSRDGSSRVLAISNAHAPGEDSDAEHDYEAWRKTDAGLAPADMLYDSLEAPADVDLADDASVLRGLIGARGDSAWVSPERLLAEIRDPRTTAAMARRFYLDQIVAEEDRPFDAAKFAELARPGYLVPPGALITLGFDGSLTRDWTALIGTEVETGHDFVIGIWEPEPNAAGSGEPWINMAEVDQTVADAFSRWQVWRMYADPYKWGTHLAKWAGEFGAERVVSWPTTNYKKMAHATAAFAAAIRAGELSHDGDPRLMAAVANACKHVLNIRDDDGELMYVPQKERPDSPLKIDPAVAEVLSHQAREDAVALGVLTADQPMGVSLYIPGEAEP